MAGPSPVDSFYATFPRLKSVLYRSTSILAFILFFLTYQMAILEFLIDEQEKGVCISASKHYSNFFFVLRISNRLSLFLRLSLIGHFYSLILLVWHERRGNDFFNTVVILWWPWKLHRKLLLTKEITIC